jgi:predicted metal-dependent HD superfamily phosphohydrolase
MQPSKPTSIPEKLDERWLALWNRIGASGDGRTVLADLAARHSEPHRAYHTLDHISHCLAELDRGRETAKNPDAIELALWFHDAIYDTHARDNELRSAELLRATAKSQGVNGETADLAAEFILATTHARIPEDPDAQLLVDIDLSILGESAERFDEYERQIRHEYAWVPEDVFRHTRAAILKSFLDRDHIYSTAPFRGSHEQQARRNLARSILQLSSSIPRG